MGSLVTETHYFFLALGLFSRAYLVASAMLVLLYFLRHLGLHRMMWCAKKQGQEQLARVLELVQDHCQGLRQAEHIALGLGRALFAQLSLLLFLFTPMLRATDAEPWLSVPHFLVTCQLCFLPVLILLTLDWLLSAHLRKLIRSH